ncbi:C6 transcription factor [Metarhizium brunneum]
MSDKSASIKPRKNYATTVASGNSSHTAAFRQQYSENHIEDVKGELIREAISLKAFPPADAAESDSEARQGDQEEEEQLEYDGPQADSADKPQEASQEEENHQNHQPIRKRPRLPTVDSDDEQFLPRLSRYGRAMRETTIIAKVNWPF